MNVKLTAVASPSAEFLKNIDDIVDYPWAFPNLEVVSTSKNNFYNTYYKRIQANNTILYEIDDIDARIRLALSGQAATVCPTLSVASYLKTGALIKLPVEIDDYQVCVYHHSHRALSNKSQYIVDSMKEFFSLVNN